MYDNTKPSIPRPNGIIKIAVARVILVSGALIFVQKNTINECHGGI